MAGIRTCLPHADRVLTRIAADVVTVHVVATAPAGAIDTLLPAGALRVDAAFAAGDTTTVRTGILARIITDARTVIACLVTRARPRAADGRWQAFLTAGLGIWLAGAKTVAAGLRRPAVACRATG